MTTVPTFAAICLLVSLLSAIASEKPATVRDRLWVWSHDASFDWPAHEAGETPGKNSMNAGLDCEGRKGVAEMTDSHSAILLAESTPISNLRPLGWHYSESLANGGTPLPKAITAQRLEDSAALVVSA